MMVPACEVVERAAAVEPFCFVVDPRSVVEPQCGEAHLLDVALFVTPDAFQIALPGFVSDPEVLAAEEEGVDPLADFGWEAEEG